MAAMIKDTDNLIYEDRMKVLKLLVDAGVKVHRSSDGSRINLSTLPLPILEEVKALVKKLSIVPPEHKY